MSKFPKLFTPAKIGKLTITNRLIMPPMVLNYASKDGSANQRYIAHIESIAKGGVGAIILEASYIDLLGKGFASQMGIHADHVIPGLKKLAQVAHKNSTKIGIQLYHAGRQTSSKNIGQQTLAPSAIAEPLSGEMPRALKLSEIKDIIKKFGEAGLRAKKAGLDFVEIHAAHGYLITQFLSPFSNERRDIYGGTPEKRFRFLREVYEAVRKNVGDNFPIMVRISGDEFVKGGLTINDSILIAQKLEAIGADAIHVTSSNYGSYLKGLLIQPMAVKENILVPLAKQIKNNVNIPVITVGKIRNPKLAEKIISDGWADFVAIGRPLLADPNWPKKVSAGNIKEINNCICCNQGCISRLFAGQDARCTVNASSGHELDFAKKSGKKKKIIVVGGGPGGMTAAITASKRGHSVTLYEQSKYLGGQLLIASQTPHRDGWEKLRLKLIYDLRNSGVIIKTKTKLTPELLKSLSADAIILAMGSSPKRPDITGINHKNVVLASDILYRKSRAKGRVAIAGGGCVGLQMAEYLAVRKHPVTIIEMSDQLATETPIDEKALAIERLKNLGVNIMLNTKILEINSTGLKINSNQKNQQLLADTVVLCLGAHSNDGLKNIAKKISKRVITIGDAVSPRRINDAIWEGAKTALAL